MKCQWNEDKIVTLLMDEQQLKSGWDVLEPIEGITYIGETKRDKPNGYGIGWEKKSGEKIYEGHWKDGEPNGFGKNYHRGFVDHPFPFFIANFRKQRIEGTGVHFAKNGKIIFRGKFKNDEYNENQFFMKFKENGEIDLGNFKYEVLVSLREWTGDGVGVGEVMEESDVDGQVGTEETDLEEEPYYEGYS
jgi:hypothetical protein